MKKIISAQNIVDLVNAKFRFGSANDFLYTVILKKSFVLSRSLPNSYDFVCQIKSRLTKVYCTKRICSKSCKKTFQNIFSEVGKNPLPDSDRCIKEKRAMLC